MIYAVNKRTKEHKNVTTCGDAVYQYIYCDKQDWEILFADADGWIEWSGGECPLPDECSVSVKFNGREPLPNIGLADSYWWGSTVGGSGRITHYRPVLEKKSEQEKEWDGEGLPEEGVRCECRLDRWEEGRVVGDDCEDGFYVAIVRVRDKYHGVPLNRLRPIRTDRDQWVSEAQKHCTEFSSKQLGHIYDALASGELEMPEVWK